MAMMITNKKPQTKYFSLNYKCSWCGIIKNCDEYETEMKELVCGRFEVKENSSVRQCSEYCNNNYLRAVSAPTIKNNIEYEERNLPLAVNLLKKAEEKNLPCSSMMSKIVKHNKMRIELLTKLLTGEMWESKIQFAFIDLSILAMEIAEDSLEFFPELSKAYMYWINKSVEEDSQQRDRWWSAENFFLPEFLEE